MTRSTFPTISIFALIFALLTLPHVADALPVGSVDLMFSTDGGTTFLDAATVDQMEPFLLRIYFDNTGDEPGTSSSLSITLPAGFARTGSSTRLCLEPVDGEIVCSEDAGQGGAIDETSVWSGQDLTISPTAGLYSRSTGETSGLLEIGKLAFLNLHDCHYFNGAERFYTTADPDIAGTNVANALDAAAACAGTVGAYGNAGQELRSAGLLAQRYLNYHECHYNFFTDHIYRDTDGTATRTSNTVDAAFNCAGTAGAHILHPDSTVVNFDLLGNRYLNLWECRYISGGDLISLNSVGSNTSTTPDAAPSCPATFGAYTLNDSDSLALDTLDTSRGRGFVEVEVASSGAGDFDLDAALSATEFATLNDMGTVTVIDTTPAPMPSVDIQFSQDISLVDDVTPLIGENFLTRIYFDNTGNANGTGAQITTTLPPGFERVPGTTRVCIEPTAGEVICNTDSGQGGPIDEAMVWSGDTLSIAPAAGLREVAPDATMGALSIGQQRYLNIHECHYYDGFSDRLFLTLDQGMTGTNVSNTIDTVATCEPVAHGRNLVGGAVTTLDLQGNHYLNIHECQYDFFFVDRIFLFGSGFTSTSASNQMDPAISCLPTAGGHSLLPGESHLQTLDFASQRYLNLHECVLLNGTDHIAQVAGAGNGTNASDSADTMAVCPAMSGAHNLVAGAFAALDLLDPTRGRGFVEYRVIANGSGSDQTQTATLDGADFDTQTDDGTLFTTTVTSAIFADGFESGSTSAWSTEVP
ncbi:MAG: hypothetical protein MPN21_17785 [Thermoanaerobaculia bacterium]|nr:hypothetical protein [Thermoanaerobaculia bacterium]